MRSDQITRRGFVGGAVALAAAGVAPWRAMAAEAGDAAKRKVAGWQIGCYTRPWAAFDAATAMDAIAEAGFKHIGLMTTKGGLILSPTTALDAAAKVGEEARKRGLQIASVWGGDVSVARGVQAGIDSLKKMIDNCAAAGARNVLMGGAANEKQYADYYKAIAECCDYAAEKKVGINLKPHGGSNSTGPQCRKTIELVRHKQFTLWYDPGNIFYYSDGKLDPVDDAPSVDGIVSGMCVKDFKPPKSVDLTPGTGKVDFPAVFAKLKKGGFTGGPLIIETLAPGQPGDLKQTLEEAKKAKAFVEGLIR